jgi:hypothetical protein
MNMTFDLDRKLGEMVVLDPLTADMTMMYELVELMEELPDSLACALRFCCSWRHIASGLWRAGPLVHFLARFHRKGYKEILVTSFKRCPMSATTYMLYRLINGSADDEKVATCLLSAALKRVDLHESSMQSLCFFTSAEMMS